MLVVSEKHESEQSWCKSLPFSDQQWDQQGNLIVCFSEAQQWPWNTHREAISWRSSGHTWQHVPQISKQTSTKTCSRWWRAEKKANLRDVRVPINVADVVIWQASKEIDQMLQRWMTTCYTGKTETLTTTHQVIFFLQIKLRTTSQLGRFCTETHKLINSSNHSLQKKNKWLQKQKLTVLNTSTWHLIDNNVKGSAVCSRSRLLKLQFITYNYVCMYIYLATWNWIV